MVSLEGASALMVTLGMPWLTAAGKYFGLSHGSDMRPDDLAKSVVRELSRLGTTDQGLAVQGIARLMERG